MEESPGKAHWNVPETFEQICVHVGTFTSCLVTKRFKVVDTKDTNKPSSSIKLTK